MMEQISKEHELPYLVEVNVTQDHIDCGTPQEPKFCPIALALDEQHMGDWDVDSNVCTLSYDRGTHIDWAVYDLSHDAEVFVDAYDNQEHGGVVYPQSFKFKRAYRVIDGEEIHDRQS